jgi:hypothetical protein
MEMSLLTKLFGKDEQWAGPCVVVVDGEASVQVAGGDAIGGGGMKAFAPRTASGRVVADSVLLMKDGSALLLLQQQRIRNTMGDEIIKQTLTIADPKHVIAVEFGDTSPLIIEALGLTQPIIKGPPGSNSGVLSRPKPASSAPAAGKA